MVSANPGNHQTSRHQDYQRQNSGFQRSGLEKRVTDRQGIVITDLVSNIRQIPWITNAEYKEGKIIYHIRKGRKAKDGCRTLKDSFKILLERHFGGRDDLIADIKYQTENEGKGVYSMWLEIEADDKEKALYEVASKLNEKLECYINSLR